MAHFLIDADLPRATAEVARSGGHEAADVRDVGLTAASDEAIAAYAKRNECCLLTRDMDFSNVKDYPLKHTPALWSSVLPTTPVAAPYWP